MSAIPALSDAFGLEGGTGAPSTITRPVAGRAEAPKMARESSLRPEPASPVTPSTSPARTTKFALSSAPRTVRFSTESRGAAAPAGAPPREAREPAVN